MPKVLKHLREVTHPAVYGYELCVPCSSATALSDPSETFRVLRHYPEHPEGSSGSGHLIAQNV